MIAAAELDIFAVSFLASLRAACIAIKTDGLL